MSKTTILHAFFYISPPSLHNYGVKWSNFVVDLRRERQRHKFYYLSLNLDTVPSLQFQPNVHTLSHWATWYESEKVSMDAKSIFQRRFHWGRCCRIIRSLMGAERGARGRHACLYRAPRSFSHFSFCNAGRRLLTKAISQPKFHENWATKLGIKKKGKAKDGSTLKKREDAGDEVEGSRIESAVFLCCNWYFIIFLIQSRKFQDGGWTSSRTGLFGKEAWSIWNVLDRN